MKKIYFAAAAAIVILSACAGQAEEPDAGGSGSGTDHMTTDLAEEGQKAFDAGTSVQQVFTEDPPAEEPPAEAEQISQTGAAGSISLSLPEGWDYALCPEESEMHYLGDYGIQFFPEGRDGGCVELCYMESFGVCGVGLEEEEVTLAGDKAFVGTYDNGEYWNFVAFKGKNEGMVALTYDVENWWPEYGEQVMEILDTLVYEPDNRQIMPGCLLYTDSFLTNLGLSLGIQDVTPAGATLVFVQAGGEPTGDLEFSEDFIVEKKDGEEWKEAPIILDGDYGFNLPAYMIKTDSSTEYEVDWEWLYGELAPGEYRIGKSILDFRESGDYDEYMIYAYFTFN